MPPTDPPAAVDDHLGALADALLDHQPWDGPARLVAVVAADEQAVDLLARELGGHPAAELLGFVAPEDWLAVGVSCTGWAARYAPDRFATAVARGTLDVRPSAAGDRVRVRQVTVASRRDTWASRLHLAGDAPVDAGAPAGLVPDCLARTLGLATAPPAVPAAEVLLVAWCEELARAADVVGGPLTWREVSALAPPPVPPGDGWAALRWAAVTGDLPVPDLGPTIAAWMDDGMFARWVLSGTPPLADAVRRARRVLTGDAARRLDRVVAELVPDRST